MPVRSFHLRPLSQIIAASISWDAPSFTIQPVASAKPPANLFPAAQWNGTPGSGFGGSNPAAPVDPTRTTAKPALRLITPAFQWFTDKLDVGVIAAANNNGSLANTLGIASVRFYYEGRTVTVTQPTWQRIQTERGPRLYYGWWVRLKKPAATAGHARLYVEATARDGTMQKRVIGPYIFSPQNALYDAQLTIAPSQSAVAGSRYQTLTDAIAWVKANGRINPLLTITEAGTYNFGTSAGELYTNNGYVNVTASVPVTIGRTAFAPTGSSNVLNDRAKLHLFGQNITVDFRNCVTFEQQAAVPADVAELCHWFDGVTLTNSDPRGNGVGDSAADIFQSGVTRSIISSRLITGSPWHTEVNVSGLHNPMIGSLLIRGCYASDLGADVANASAAIVQSRFERSSNSFWIDDRPAFSVVYTGAEATATIARSGAVVGGGGGIYTVKIGGTTYTRNTGQPSFFTTAESRFFGELVTWLNTIPGITATLLIQPFDRIASSGSLPGFFGQGFGDTNIKTTPLTVVSNLDIHGDWYQHQGGGVLENSVIAFNEVLDFGAQIIFLSPPSPAPRDERDLVFFGNIFHAPGAANNDPIVLSGGSQWGRPNLPLPASHVVFAHNTWVNQQILLRNEGGGLAADAYCLMRNNVVDAVSVLGSTVTNLTIRGLHLNAGKALPTQVLNGYAAGNIDTLFVDADAYDFRPTGALLERGFAPVIPTDRTRTLGPPTAAVGAIFAEAPEYISPPVITASAITGTALNGQTLTASATVVGGGDLGTGTPTLAYQWQRQGVNIAGQTAPTLTISASGMGIARDDVLSCEITATNSAGTATAEPSVVYDLTPFVPSSLFTAGEQGFVFEPNPTNCGVAVGQSVQTMTDTSGKGNNATQATAGNRPLLWQSGALYGLDFDGTDDWLQTAAINMTGSDQITVIAGISKDADTAAGLVLEFGTNTGSVNGSFVMTAPENAGASGNFGFGVRGTASGNVMSGTILSPATRVITGMAEITPASRTMRVNGTQVATSTASLGTGNFGNLATFLGRRNGATLPFNGRLHAVIVVNRTLTPTELANAEAWVTARTPL